jgi:hypothetical protein
MTVIAYRDGVLATDQRGFRGDTAVLSNKIHKVSDGWMAGAGSTATILEVVNWYRAGADPKEFPANQRTENNDVIVLLTKHGVFVFERGPFPVRFRGDFLACGSGAAYAHTAMHLGKSSLEAAKVAGELCITCGGGVDFVRLDDDAVQEYIE